MTQRFSSRRQLLGAIAFAALTLGLSANSYAFEWSHTFIGTGQVEKREIQAKDYSAVSIGIPGSIEIIQDNSEGLSIETNKDMLPQIEVTVERNTLKIRPLEKNTALKSTVMNVVIHVKNIDDLSLGGSGEINIKQLNAGKLHVAVGGSGVVNITSLSADALRVSMGGSGSFNAGGKVNESSYSIGGSGKIDTGKLQADSVSVSIGGSGNVAVAAKNSLSVSIAGSGSVRYYGNPQISRSIAGSGSVTRIGELN